MSGPRRLFVLPPRELMESRGLPPGGYNYSVYNYYRPGVVGAIKRWRFELALRMVSDRFGGRAIDMGCADGVLLPSLSAHFERVVGIDHGTRYLAEAAQVVLRLGLANVETLCNAGVSFEEIARRIGPGFATLFLLETLEHVGSQPDIWGSKIEFLARCFDLLEPEGRIVISVPRMVGPVLLVKQLVQRTLGMGYDPMSVRQLLAASLLYRTDELEPLWDGYHVGFNHLKLERHLATHFTIHRRLGSLISVFYLIGR